MTTRRDLKSKRRSGILVLAVTAAFGTALVVHPASAASRNLTWDPSLNGTGSDGSGTWDNGTTADWATGSLPDVTWSSANPDNAIFGSAGTAGTVTLNSAVTANNITFNSGVTGNYTIAGGTANNVLGIAAGGTITDNTPGVTTISAFLAAAANGGAFTIAGTGSLTFGNIGPTGNSPVITLNTTGTTTFGGATDNYGTTAIVNSGTLVLAKTSSSGAHAIGGGFTIAGANAIVQLSGTGGDQIYDGDTVTVNSGTFDFNALNESFAGLAGSGGIVTNNAASGTTSTMTLLNSGSTYGGVIQDGTNGGKMALTVSNGTQVLTGANTFSGLTSVTGGVLRANAGSGLSPNSNVTLNGGVLESGTNFTQTLGTAAGNVQLIGGASGFSANGAAINVNLSGGAGIQWGTATFSPTTLVLNQTTANNTITFLNNIDLNAATRTVNVDANTATISGLISTSSGTAGLTTGGAGTLVLSNAANSYNGGTTISAGTLSVSSLADGATGPLGNSAGTVALTGGTLLYTGTGDTTARTFTASTSANSGINVQNAAATLTLNASTSLTGNSASSLVTSGPGTLVLAGSVDNNGLVLNASAGTTQLDKPSTSSLHAVAGISNIALGATVQFTGTGANQVYGGSATGAFSLVNMSGGTLDFNGTSQGWDRLSGYGTITNTAAAPSTMTLGQSSGGPATFSGNIMDGTGQMALTKTGTGTQILSGANTYSGATTISGGILRLAPTLPVGNATMWLDASNTSSVTVSGGNVTAWNDLTGNGHNATQAVTADQPIYTTNSLVGGKNVVRFNATGQVLDFNQSFLNGSPYTIFSIEAKANGGATSNNPYYYLGTMTSNTNQGLHFGYRGDTDFTLAQYGNDIDYTSAPAFTTQTFREWSGELNTAATGGGHFLYANGSQVASSTSTATLTNPGQGVVGEGYSGTTSQYFGDLGEIVIYTYALTSAQRALVDTYLQGKWLGTSTNFNVLPSNTPVTITGTGTLDLNGYSQTIGSLSGVAGTSVTLGTVPTAALTTGSAGGTTFAGVISGSGGLTKQGAATTFILSGLNTYTGPTNVAAGTLDLKSGSLATGNITITSGATLTGDSAANPGTIQFNIAGNTPDAFSNAGTLTISNLILALNVTGTQTLTSYLIESGSYTGPAFQSVTYDGGSLPAGDAIQYNANSIVLTTMVPEPASIGLIGLGALGLLARRRRLPRQA
jgi:fibronectin-binding autotransporter adhesin